MREKEADEKVNGEGGLNETTKLWKVWLEIDEVEIDEVEIDEEERKTQRAGDRVEREEREERCK